MILQPRRGHAQVHYAARRSSDRRYYYQRRPEVFLPRTVVASGPIFALVQPVSHPIETQPPADGLHPRADHHDAVAAGTEFLLVVVVILIAGWQVIARVIRVVDGRSADARL